MIVKENLQRYKEIVECNEPFCIKDEAWYMMEVAYQYYADEFDIYDTTKHT